MMDHDVIVVGSGNAALSAALSAHETGARVLVVEKSELDEAGGNSRYTGGLFRCAYPSTDDLGRLIPGEQSKIDELGLQPYPQEAFVEDLMRLSYGESDRKLTERYAGKSLETLLWYFDMGVEFTAGEEKWSVTNPGAALWIVGEGKALVARLTTVAKERGIDFRYGDGVVDFLVEDGAVVGVILASGEQVNAAGVVLACGGFEANPDLRAKYLGPEWRNVKVRGTRHNTGDLYAPLEKLNAAMVGHWAGCHATPLDAKYPATGNIEMAEMASRHSFPYGILVNEDAQRFADEGEDFPLYKYAKIGSDILKQQNGKAFEIFDARGIEQMDYRYERGTYVEAETIPELAEKAELDVNALTATVDSYNAAVSSEDDFDPMVRDGVSTTGLTPPKTNWATRISVPPFRSYPVNAGITFTYGGVEVDTEARVISTDGSIIKGLFATGEIAGGFFAHNYAAGSGLMMGAVFGRIAGAHAAEADTQPA